MALLLLAGLVLLLGGAEALIRGSVAIAHRLGVPPMVIGMTVVAFGTSAPELVVSVRAALAGAAGIALGNLVGSNIANVLLIIGLSSLLTPLALAVRQPRNAVVLVAGTLLFVLLAVTGTIERWGGGLLLLGFAAFLAASGWQEKQGKPDVTALSRQQEIEHRAPSRQGLAGFAVLALGGLAAVLYGADILVDGAVALARLLDVSEAVIGLTVIAVGTSLPELAASAVAGLRRHPDVAIGNIVGSNLFNLLAIGGIAGVVRPLPVDLQILAFDLWVMLGATLLLLPLLSGWRCGRLAGVVLLAGYGGYLAAQVSAVFAARG
jgi:cation:H+ antiporter